MEPILADESDSGRVHVPEGVNDYTVTHHGLMASVDTPMRLGSTDPIWPCDKCPRNAWHLEILPGLDGRPMIREWHAIRCRQLQAIEPWAQP